MAELINYQSGVTLYAQFFNRANGQVWHTGSSVFQAFVDANWTSYAVNLTEQGTASGAYLLTLPSGLSASTNYYVRIFSRSGGSAAITDTSVGDGEFGPRADGAILALNGLDLVDPTMPAGLTSNFRGRVNQLYARFFCRRQKTANQIIVSDPNDNALTVQDYTVIGGVQQVEKAE